MKRTLTPAAWPLTILAAGLALLAPRAGRAAGPTRYALQPIVRLGDPIGGVTAEGFMTGALNDRGQLVFAVDLSQAPVFWLNLSQGEILVEYAGGSFRVIAAPGQPSPDGTWPDRLTIDTADINQRGDIVFAASESAAPCGLGAYLWSDQTQKLTAVAETGTPAVRGLTFQAGPGFWLASINNQGEIAFAGRATDAAGNWYHGVFLASPAGQIQAVAFPGDPLPNGGQADWPGDPSLNDAGRVAFLSGRITDGGNSAYVWENGTITPVVLAGSAAPDGGTITDVIRVWVNNQDRSVLVLAQKDSQVRGLGNLYRWSNGALTAVAVPGQAMPGGGLLNGLNWGTGSVSAANQAGQHAFIAQLQDNSTAAYRTEADGKPSLILKSGEKTNLGTITQMGSDTDLVGNGGIALNSQGQVALTVQIDNGPWTLVLLTPTTSQ